MTPFPPSVAHFELAFSPNIRLVSKVRRFVMGFYEEVLEGVGEALAEKIALATHELLENVIKYSSRQETRLMIEVTTQDGGDRAIVIRTWNHATELQIAGLRKVFEAFDASEDKQAYYQELMKRPAERADSGGMGLGRIIAEADMSLTLKVEDTLVCIEARTFVKK